MIKTTGAEFKQFYDDKEFWTDGFFHEEEIITVDGKNVCDDMGGSDIDLGEVADDAEMEISEGIVFKDDYQEVCSFESYFLKWRKQHKFVFIVVESPKDKADGIKNAIKAAGGKIMK